ncbi:hypothetical protein Tco_1102397 [Tanacetum coccineum]
MPYDLKIGYKQLHIFKKPNLEFGKYACAPVTSNDLNRTLELPSAIDPMHETLAPMKIDVMKEADEFACNQTNNHGNFTLHTEASDALSTTIGNHNKPIKRKMPTDLEVGYKLLHIPKKPNLEFGGCASAPVATNDLEYQWLSLVDMPKQIYALHCMIVYRFCMALTVSFAAESSMSWATDLHALDLSILIDVWLALSW